MSENIKYTTCIAEDVQSFGVCAKESTINDNYKYILHLRVHTKKPQKHTTTHTTGEDVSSILPNNDTYNDLMRYTPELSDVPVAYEQNHTDSHPLVLAEPNIIDVKCTTENATTTQVVGYNEDTAGNSPLISICTKCMNTSNDDLLKIAENQQHCWWCTYHFHNEPFSVPIRMSSNNQYDTVGCFCSPECAAAYIFEKKIGTGDPWKQYEMLHRMVNKLHNGVEIRIKLAPPRETLQRYGGPYKIDTYRTILQDYRKHVRISMPPINPIHKMIEEVAVDYTKKQHKFLPIDSTRVKKAENELCLKRKKKQTAENTLEAFMRLRMDNSN
jgi:hypothetical protein